jgi:hypothetical protein
MELAAAGQDLKKLRAIAKVHIERCEAGDMHAIKELADRLDGKPKQESDVAVTSTRYVVEVPADLSDEEWEKKYSLPMPNNVQ